jgi:tetratricopeptide (TPR) repeat protein/thiol-disulfide isomerase/thioredoxin/outer membrane lipoprotein-sorting protein
MKYAVPLLIASAGFVFAAPSEDPQEIIKRAGGAYEQFKTCQIVASSTNLMTGDEWETTVKSKLRISLEKPGKLRVESRGVMTQFLVSNGVDTWTYFAGMKEYTKRPASASVQGDLGSNPWASGLLIRGNPKDAKLIGEQEMVIEGAPRRCHVIQADGEHGERFKYWIDEKNYLVLRTEMTSASTPAMPGVPPMRMTQNTVVESLKIGEGIADDVFTFTPPSDAKLVAQFGVANGAIPSNQGSQYIGKSAADFTLRDLSDKPVRLSDLRGKVVVLDFWATWCGPCREEMPDLEELQKANKDIVVLGVDVGEDETQVKKFVSDNHITFPILLAGQDRMIEDYGAHGYPTTVVIDKSGAIRSYTVGYATGGDSNLRVAIKRAGKETGMVAPPVEAVVDGPGAPAPKPKTAEEAYYAGSRLIREHRPDDGIRLFSQAIAMKPDWAYPWWARGLAFYQQKRYEEAIKDISKAIELRGTMPTWYDERGLAYSYSGHHERAIPDYTKAMELAPNGVAAYYNNRGWAYLSLNQPEKALPDLNRAIELTPDFIKAHENRGSAHLKLKQHKDAIADFTAAIELAPTQWQFEQRAQARAAIGDQEGAAEDRKLGAALNKPAVVGGLIEGVPPAPPAMTPLKPSDAIDESLAAPELVLPADQVVFDSYPRKTVCEWKASPGAVSYVLQWDYQFDGLWRLDQQNGEGFGYAVNGTTYAFNFVGAQPGRWRVWPVGASGTRGKPSEWRTFRYTK